MISINDSFMRQTLLLKYVEKLLDGVMSYDGVMRMFSSDRCIHFIAKL